MDANQKKNDHRVRSSPGAFSEQKIIENQTFSFFIHLEKSLKSLQLLSNSCFCLFYILHDHRITKHTFWATKLVPKWYQNDHGRYQKQGLENAPISGHENVPKWRPKMVQNTSLGGLWALLGGPRVQQEPQEAESNPRWPL